MSGTYEFNVICVYCDAVLFTITGASAAAWKKDAADGGFTIECACGGTFVTADDGVPVSSGGGVQIDNISAPQITSLNAVSGAREGGNALVISGHALDVGALVVKFGGRPAPVVDERTVTTARVVLPPATYTLNVLEQCHKLTLSITSGSLSIDEAITTTAGSSGIVRQIIGSDYWIAFANFAETLEAMVGTNLVGGGAGGTASISAATAVAFAVDEVVTGLSSGAFAVFRDFPLVVNSPTAGFAPSELVRGDTSGALVKLTSSPAYSGLVDVTVENENGQHSVGGALSGAYTYT